MFQRILSLAQKKTNTASLPDIDVPHATGALLVRAAKADNVYLIEEIEVIDDVLAHRYSLSPEEAAKLRKECETLDTLMPVGAAFAEVLCDAIDYDERVAMVLALWEVVFADGHKVEEEDTLLSHLETVLGVPVAKSKELQDLVRDLTT